MSDPDKSDPDPNRILITGIRIQLDPDPNPTKGEKLLFLQHNWKSWNDVYLVF